MIAIALPLSSKAQSWTFDSAQLGGVGKEVDMSIFDKGGQLPGTYIVDIVLNGDVVDTKEMEFKQSEGVDGKFILKTCLKREMLVDYGIKVGDFPDLFPSKNIDCAHLDAIPGAIEDFQMNNQQLLLSIPQIALEPKLKGIAPKALWNDGAPVILMNYQMNGTHTESRGIGKQTNEAYFARLDPGINLGAWRLRNMSSYQKTGGTPGKWGSTQTWAERGLYNMNSRLTMGQYYTPSDVMDSIPFDGLMLSSDDAMLPISMRDAAPIVRGIARTQARVDVKQNGNIIYSTTVAPGAFALTDLSTGGNGDLHVTVHETDGPAQEFTVPWTAPAVALRESSYRYNLMAGTYRPEDKQISSTKVSQMTVMYGLPWNLTGYGGVQWAEHFLGTTFGAGMLLGNLGAMSVDITQGRGLLPDNTSLQGYSWRLRYNKVLNATKTGFSLNHIEYSPEGEVSLGRIQGQWRKGNNEYDPLSVRNDWRRKSRTTLGLSQSIFGMGYINLTASRESYRNGFGNRDELGTSFSSGFKGINWSLHLNQRKIPVHGNTSEHKSRREEEISLWINIPLDRWFGGNPSASYQMLSGSDKKVKHEIGLNGEGYNRQIRWNVSQQFQPGDNGGTDNNGNANMAWNGTYGVLDTGYSYSKSSRQMNAGLSGGMIIHEHGLTIGQPLGNTTALISTPGVSGVSAGSWAGVKTDFRGYTSLSGLSPYQGNIVELDPTTLPPNAEITKTGIKVIPTDGAVIPVRFPIRVGARAIITLNQSSGKPVPFGSVVTVNKDTNQGTGIVGSDGEVYMSGLTKKGLLDVHWGLDKHCKASFQLPDKESQAGIYTTQAICQ